MCRPSGLINDDDDNDDDDHHHHHVIPPRYVVMEGLYWSDLDVGL